MLSLQNNRDGAVVYERHVHHGPEAACLDLSTPAVRSRSQK